MPTTVITTITLFIMCLAHGRTTTELKTGVAFYLQINCTVANSRWVVQNRSRGKLTKTGKFRVVISLM